MAKLIAFLAAIALLAGVFIYDSRLTPAPMEAQENVRAVKGQKAPDFNFRTMDGKTMSLSALPGYDEVLIHFWAGWCGVCFEEFPSLLNYVGRQNGKTALIAIAIDDTLPPAKAFLKRLGADMDQENVYWTWDSDKSISLKTFGTVAVPETIVLNRDLVMADKYTGPHEW